MDILFKDQISEVRCNPKRRYHENLIFDTRNITVGYRWGIIPIKERKTGFFHTSVFRDDEYHGTVEEYNSRSEHTYYEDGNFYYKPHLLIRMVTNNPYRIFFETENEMFEYAEELKTIGPHIVTE